MFSLMGTLFTIITSAFRVRSFVSSGVENAYFVTKYSKASEKEDRAEIFAEIMVMSKKEKYLYKDGKIYLKAKNIMNKIEENITYNNFYCDRFLN